MPGKSYSQLFNKEGGIQNVRSGRSDGSSGLESTGFPPLPDRQARLLHLVVHHDEPWECQKRYFGVLGYMAFITGDTHIVDKDGDFIRNWVSRHTLADIISQSSFVLPAWICETGPTGNNSSWNDFMAFSKKITPAGLQFSFYNHHLAPLPVGPAEYLFSAVSSRMLWHDSETFVDFFVAEDLEERMRQVMARKRHVSIPDSRQHPGSIQSTKVR